MAGTDVDARATLQHQGDTMDWRKAERQRLIAARLAMSAAERRSHTARIEAGLVEAVGKVRGQTVGVYWPFRGEPNLRRWMEWLLACGGACALPVVVQRHAPLVFREWHPGARMVGGVWNIPVPADGAEVVPDIVIAPVVGFDPRCYRLGYGGGFYDRTLAAMAGQPRVIGVGYAQALVATIRPQPHDIAMHLIVTEHGVVVPARA
jgi:5,10-methenyltetrahydrofolate synthetase